MTAGEKGAWIQRLVWIQRPIWIQRLVRVPTLMAQQVKNPPAVQETQETWV